MRKRYGLLLWIAIAAAGVQARAAGFTDELWKENRDIYDAILTHPFLQGLQDGTLPRAAFSFYMIQDAHYLHEFARALGVMAAHAPRPEWAALLNTHAADSFKEEQNLHQGVFKEYGIEPAQVAAAEPSPEAFAYTSFLVSTAYGRPFSDSIASVLPCYWIYWEVGKELKRRGSKDPVYQKWIDNYASEAYGESVKAVLAMADRVAAAAGPEELARMRQNFRRSARYEWMFWDSAFYRRGWPVGR